MILRFKGSVNDIVILMILRLKNLHQFFSARPFLRLQFVLATGMILRTAPLKLVFFVPSFLCC